MRRWLALAVWIPLSLTGALARAAEPASASQDAVPSEAALDGDEIYRRVLRNRLRSYVEESVLVSGNRGGSEQATRLVMTWKSFRPGPEAAPAKSVLSKTLVRYTEPFDLRDSGYLIVNHEERPTDQFVYLPSFRRVRRVNLRGEAIFGTDFSFEDAVPREFEESEHRRIADEPVAETPCYVVELVPRPDTNSDYSRLWIYVEKRHYVPLRTRYWDTRGIEVKELLADPATIREFAGVHIPMAAVMRNLLLGTYTLRIDRLEANPELPETTFDLRRLIRH